MNGVQGVVYHSAVGSIEGVIKVVLAPKEKQGKNPRSVTAVVGYDGRFVQFYPITASAWANGSHLANRLFVGVEHEGGKPGNESEPLTPEQFAVDVRILQDLAAWKNVGPDYWRRPAAPDDGNAGLYEHREMVHFGAAATACPSGRIPWDEILAVLQAPAPRIVGIGIHNTDGSELEVWHEEEGLTLDGVGFAWSDGTQTRVWPP